MNSGDRIEETNFSRTQFIFCIQHPENVDVDVDEMWLMNIVDRTDESDEY